MEHSTRQYRKCTDAEVLAAYRELGTQHKAAAVLGISQPAVAARLRRLGVCIGKGKNQRLLDVAAVLSLWKKHRNQHVIANILGVHQASISRALRKNGIRVGKIGRAPRHDLPMDEVASRYLAGESCREIATDYEVDPEVVRRRLRSRKVARRHRGQYEPRGAKNLQWKGGYKPTMHYHRRQAYEVAAICLGQPLPQGWVIHHVDENPMNNEPANLLLFRSQREHCKYHQLLLKLQRAGETVDAIQLALENGALALPLPPSPILLLPDKGRRSPSRKQPSPA